MTKKTLVGILLAVIMAATAYLAFSTLAMTEDDAFGVAFDEDL